MPSDVTGDANGALNGHFPAPRDSAKRPPDDSPVDPARVLESILQGSSVDVQDVAAAVEALRRKPDEAPARVLRIIGQVIDEAIADHETRYHAAAEPSPSVEGHTP